MASSTAGADRLWDFTAGPTAVIYRFDYLAASSTPHSGAFVTAGAQIAEQKLDESGAQDTAWLYFTANQAQGRLAYGFYDPGFSSGVGSSDPQVIFSSVMNDFPATIQYGSTWDAATSFTNTITFGDPEDPESSLTVDLLYAYSSAAIVDAYGIANSPGISFGDCLRVNEVVRYDVSADFGDGEGFQFLETDYVRNYYWLRQGRGIIAQVTSQQSSGTPPPDNFSNASSIVRMFQTNHPDNNGGSGNGIQGFKITVGPTGALLQWTSLASLSSYRVEYTTNLLAGSWQQVGSTTTGSFLVDNAANKPATPMRFYRVVGMP